VKKGIFLMISFLFLMIGCHNEDFFYFCSRKVGRPMARILNTSGVNFINVLRARFSYKKPRVKRWWNWHMRSMSSTILRAVFTRKDPKGAKSYGQLDWVFTLLGFLRLKAAHKIVDEIDPWWSLHSKVYLMKKKKYF